MFYRINIQTYPSLIEVSRFIKTQYAFDDIIYMHRSISPQDLLELNNKDITHLNIERMLYLCDRLEISYTYVWNNAYGEFHYNPIFPLFFYDLHESLFDKGIYNKYFLYKYKDHPDMERMSSKRIKS